MVYRMMVVEWYNHDKNHHIHRNDMHYRKDYHHSNLKGKVAMMIAHMDMALFLRIHLFHNANPKPKSNIISSSKPKANPKNASKPKPNPNSVSNPKVNPKPKTNTKAYCTRSASRMKKIQLIHQEDSSYELGRDDSSSNDDIVEKNCQAKKRDSKLKHSPTEALAKSKRKFINDDDALVMDDEECEVDLSFLEVSVTRDGDLDNALDPRAEFDGANYSHSEKMKTPPFLENEFFEEEPNDVFPDLLSIVQEVMPHVHHRFCMWHLWRNFNKQWKDLELRELVTLGMRKINHLSRFL
ncbi:hypothetical protein Ahy_A03g012799 [Arachis hypogaea]|uniref:Uncharacterized protein n=1 Tax=Arachis hypogaea TaxID=3818 RepID=A0A445DU77_ARAHY|nr:hypothetical protein Ahy_A03g012799 [Arachis hypogaea]